MAPLALLIATLSAMATKSHAKCGQEIPKEPQCGKSELVSIRVEDPNLGEVGRSFTLHIPAGYSAANDVEVPLVLDFHAFLGIVRCGQKSCYRVSHLSARAPGAQFNWKKIITKIIMKIITKVQFDFFVVTF